MISSSSQHFRLLQPYTPCPSYLSEFSNSRRHSDNFQLIDSRIILNAVVAEKLPGPVTVFLHVDWNFEAPVKPGDRITGVVEVSRVRTDKPITELKTTVKRDDGSVALEGHALCYTMALPLPDR